MSATPSLHGRVAIVTGASRGIGRAVAARLATAGAAVTVAARTEAASDARLPGSIHEAVEEITAAGGTAIAVSCDVADDDSVAGLIDATHQAFGPVDILVNNAALTVPDRRPRGGASDRPATTKIDPQEALSILNFPVRAYRRAFEVNLFGAYHLTQLALRDMVERRRGNVVNISSDASQVPGEGPYDAFRAVPLHAYGTSKAALEHLTRTVAYEVARFGVAVNAVLPSMTVETPGTQFVTAGHFGQTLPMGRFVDAVVALCAVTPDERTGSVIHSEDLLDPSGRRRGWLAEPYV